jgi:tRNA A58 N-methylase Trm61
VNLKVDSEDLFPLLASIEGTYAAAKDHSRQVDALLGFEIEKTEKSIADPTAPWFGLNPDILQTPYTEIRYMLARLELRPEDKIIELGSGYSRMAHVVDAHAKGVVYEGVELVAERAQEAIRVIRSRNLRSASVRQGDLFGSAGLPRGDVYFLYDLSSKTQASVQVVEALRQVALEHPIRVVARGLASRQWIERGAPWLSQVVVPAHYGNFSIYRSG